MRAILVFFIAALSPLEIAAAETFALGTERLTTAELAHARGGFITAGGLQIDLGIRMDTLVNGQLVLRSVFTPSVTNAQGNVQVYAPPVGTPLQGTPEPPSVSPSDVQTVPPSSALSFTFDRVNGLTMVEKTPSWANQTRVVVNTGAGAATDTATGPVVYVPLVIGGSADTGAGLVRLDTALNGPVVSLDSDTLQIRHLLGGPSAVVGNTANDRTITSNTIVGITLPNASALNIGSSSLRVEDAALAAMRGLIR
jgi:hypothetical protein